VSSTVDTAPAGARLSLPLPAGALVGAGLVGAIIVAALIAPWVVPYDPLDQDLLAINAGPSPEHWLGVDHLGRDVLSRLMMGARVTLAIGFGGGLIAFLIGGCLALAGLALGRISETLVFGAMDLARAMPGILLALLLIVALGSGAVPVAIALGISFAPLFAYVARAAYKREMAQDYVRAARIFGGGRLHVLVHHVLPNIVGGLVTQAAIILPRCIVTESVLSFLGLGSSPDAPTWGRMISDASRFIERAPHVIIPPVLALIVLTVSLSITGDYLRARLDPLRGQGERGVPAS
jgi:ABC-type dipeptide/oligopeptide/nickel transport system permease subunit